jgi:hypothetical protein
MGVWCLNELLKNRALPLSVLGLVTGAMAYHWTRNLDERAALSGFSPEQAAIVTNNPEWFARDFPSGIQETLSSVVFWIYVFADRLGVSVTHAWASMIWLEIIVFAGAIYYATRRIFPDEDWRLPTIVSALFVSSPFLSPDLGQFAFPFYGWMYGFAHACFLIGAVEALRHRMARAAVATVAAFLIHPITGLFAAAFCGAVLVVRFWRDPAGQWRTGAVFGVVVMCVFAAWTALLSARSTITGGAVDPNDFVVFTRALNYHWYPSFLGVFWETHPNNLMPLLASLALVAWAFHALPAHRDPHVFAGLLALAVVCFLGVLVAEFSTVPTLIKLCLQRADRSILLVGGIFAVRALLADLREGDPVQRGLAVILLLLPFQSSYGLAIGPVAFRVAYEFMPLGKRRAASLPLGIAAGLCVLAFVLWGVYAQAGVAAGASTYVGLGLPLAIAGLAGAASALPYLRRWQGVVQGTVSVLLIVLIAGLAVRYSRMGNYLAHEATLRRAGDYLNAQLWARANTPVGSLFMVDPAMGYMWRDKSYRPSFGSPREWLMLSIMYNSRKELFDEGIKRYMALGLPFPEHLRDPANTRTLPLLTRITADASNAYNSLDANALASLASRFGIDYFVFNKTGPKALAGLNVVFENAHLAVIAAPEAP